MMSLSLPKILGGGRGNDWKSQEIEREERGRGEEMNWRSRRPRLSAIGIVGVKRHSECLESIPSADSLSVSRVPRRGPAKLGEIGGRP